MQCLMLWNQFCRFPLCKYICLSTIFYVLSPLSQLLGLLKIKRLWKWDAVVCFVVWWQVQSVYESSLCIQLQSDTSTRSERSSIFHNAMGWHVSVFKHKQHKRSCYHLLCVWINKNKYCLNLPLPFLWRWQKKRRWTKSKEFEACARANKCSVIQFSIN